MLQIKNVYKEYKTGNLIQKALDDVSLNLRNNEFVAILGPSGSGKTTLLNIIGGLDCYDKGDIIINEISTKKYKDRDWDSYRNHTVGFVFQSYNLIPHQTILSNVELSLTISGVSKKERKQKAIEALKQVGLKNHIHKKPNQLSGGQMQRVAIARALVNNPDILLADEPTGALDSDTSVQVMELLKEVAKDRLVVMVTHNPELAEKYATRIVNLKDGKILGDTNPYVISNGQYKKAEHKNMGKTSMSFLTSLSLSFNNLKTKKGRTFLTSFAGSIGIIGIALILSLSNGVNKYIKSVEEDTLSEYPLQIQSSGIDMTSMLIEANNEADNKDKEDENIKVNKNLTNMFSTIGSNDLVSLKKHIENNKESFDKYAKDIEYKYNVLPKIYSSDIKNLRQVNPDVSFSSLGIGSNSSMNSLMSSMMSTDVFFQMPTDSKLYENQYDVKAGKWPTNYDECVLVLSPNGNISDFVLYTLGLRNYKELDKLVTQFLNEENVEVPDTSNSYSYEDILGITFKLINNSDCYEYDKEYKIWRDKTENIEYMKKIVKESEDLKIVGIVKPKEGAKVTMLKPGIGYTSSLTNYTIKNASNSKIVKEQLEKPEINVFTGKRFDETKKKNSFDMNSLIEVDTNAIKTAFKIDESKIKVDLDNLNNVLDKNSLPELDVNEVFSELEFSMTKEDIQKIINDLLNGYEEYIKKNPDTDISKIKEQLLDYLKSEEAKNIITNDILEIIKSQNIDKQLSNIMENYMKTVMNSVSKNIEKEMTSNIKLLSKSMKDAISIDQRAFTSAFKMKMTEEELSELLDSLMSKEQTTYENNLKKLNYAKFDEPTGINIYPKDFEGNKEITNLLNEYNEQMKKEGKEEKVISYTDMVGTLMSSVTTIVDTISYVLIAFIAISLVVSSIMIGVITYISVLERKKEIGILRAIGASKRNIAQVFNAETFIIGTLSGLIGIGITLLLQIPINKIIAVLSNGVNVKATLPFTAGVILILLSIILTLIGGIIPSKKAAKEDPVLALRSE